MDAPTPELRIDLLGDDTAVFAEQTLRHPKPIRAWARRLLRRNYPPELSLVVYRDSEIVQRLTIGECAAQPLFDTPRAGAEAAGGASSAEPAPPEAAPEPDRIHEPQPPPDEATESPAPVAPIEPGTGRTYRPVHVELLYEDGPVVLHLPIDHAQPYLEAARQLVILGHPDCEARVGTLTFRPGFHHWASYVVNESTTSFARQNMRYWEARHPAYAKAVARTHQEAFTAAAGATQEADLPLTTSATPQPPETALSAELPQSRFDELSQERAE